MRVKRHKPDDLADALKQLKLTDRRSRLSLRGRAANSFGLLGSSTLDTDLRCRLTRSVSSTTSSSNNPRVGGGAGSGLSLTVHCECCNTVCRTRAYVATTNYTPYRQSLDSSLHLGEDSPPRLPASSSSGFSPFTTSAGLLYSTLPTNLEFSRTINDVFEPQHAFHSSRLRRSYGVGLNQLEAEPSSQPPSTSRGSFGSVLTTSSDRHHCCLHHGLNTNQSSNQQRLYRRLYSLIDHPSVSLYHSCRSPACLHSIHSSRFSASHRHSLSLRHRHTVTPTSPFCADNIRLRSSLNGDLSTTSFQQDCLPSDSIAGSSALQHAPRVSASIEPSIYGLEGIRCQQEGSGISPLSTFASGDSEDILYTTNQTSTRCRRNSDPERWQQPDNGSKLKDEPQTRRKGTHLTSSSQHFQYSETSQTKPSLQPTYTDKCTGSIGTSSTLVNGSSSLFGFGDGVLTAARPQQLNTSKSMLYTSSTGAQKVFTDAPQYDMMVSNSPISAQTPTQSSFAFGSVRGSEQGFPPTAGVSDHPLFPVHQAPQPPQSTAFSFRPSFLSHVTMDSEQHCSLPDDSINSQLDFRLHKASGSNHWHDDGVTPTETDPMDAFGCVPRTEQASTTTDADNMLKSLQQELSTLEQQQPETTDFPSVGPNRQAMTDVSVNELAAYMEHMVHIPGRMSEMAQRMYL